MPPDADDAPGRRYDIVALVSNDLAGDQRMIRCLSTLGAAGYRCLLLGRERPGSPPLDRARPFAQERHRLRAHAGKAFYWQLNRAHERRLLQLRPRCILAADLDTVWAAARASRRLGVPWVYDAHELFTEVPEVARRPWIRAAWAWLGRRFIPRAAAHYTVGEDIAAELSRRYGVPFGVVRNYPVPTAASANALRPELRELVAARDASGRYAVLYQGALNEGRGLEELIDAVADLPGVEAWIAGGGDLEDALRRRAAARAPDRVRFTGWMPPEQLRALTPHADLGYALMRDVSLNYRLSLSNKSLDYLHAGLPSLQMDWPEYRRIADRSPGVYTLVPTLTAQSARAAIESARQAAPSAAVFAQAAARLTWASEAATLVNTFAVVFGRPALAEAVREPASRTD